MTTLQLMAAFDAGKRASLNGETAFSCPYPHGYIGRFWWADGFAAGLKAAAERADPKIGLARS